MTNKKRIQKLVFLFAALLLACNGADQTAPVGQLLPAEPLDADAERKRLQEMQYLIVKSTDPEDTRQEVWDLSRPGGEGLLENQFGHTTEEDSQCLSQLAFSGYLAGDGACYFVHCHVRVYLEAASRLLRASDGVPGQGPSLWVLGQNAARIPYVVGPHYFDNVAISVPPQSVATRALFAKVAAKVYRQTIEEARQALDDVELAAEEQVGSGLPCNATGYEFLAAEMAAVIREALIGLEKASLIRATMTVAAADKQLGSSTHASISTARAFAGEEFSRAAAAHMLVGGLPGVEGDTTKALCSSNELTAETQQAIDVIRLLAPPPAEILGLADELKGGSDMGRLDTFLNGTPSWGSLRARYEEFYGGITPIDTIQDRFELRSTDFGLAVAYLAQDLRAFSRSLQVLMSSDKVGWAYRRYAAIARPPVEPPDAYWAALARTSTHLDGSDAPSFFPASNDWMLVSDDEPYTTSRVLPETFANAAVTTVRWASEIMSELPEDARDVLSTLVAASESIGAFEHRALPFGQGSTGMIDQFGVQLFRDDGKQYYVALGDDAMRCAVQGSLEGETCDPWLAGTQPRTFALVNAPDRVGSGYTFARFSPLLQAGRRRVYLLTSRAGWVATDDELQPGPGDFEAVIGLAAHRATIGPGPSTLIKRVGILPPIEKRAADYMRLSRDDCSRPQLSCADTAGDGSNLGRFDERLPLENELSEDADGIESSWRYYLTQARNAAQESDLLAKEYVQTTLTLAQRGETEDRRAADIKRAQEEKAAAALDRVQAICGTSLDPAEVLEKVDWFAGQGPCEPDDPAEPNWKCVNGIRVASLSGLIDEHSDPDFEKLAECILETRTTQDLQLSKWDLCYWEEDGDICEGPGPHEEATCPVVADSNRNCPDGYEKLSVENSLKLFDVPGGSKATSSEGVPICDAVRLMRKYAAAGGLSASDEENKVVADVSQTGFYDEARLLELRNALSVEASYGGYVTVQVGGTTWLSTGNAADGPRLGYWPCQGEGGTPPPSPGACDTTDGFRCESFDCSDSTQRALANDRLLDAFLALEAIAQGAQYEDNPELESHIEFWLPVLVGKGLTPYPYLRSTREFLPSTEFGLAKVYEDSNDQWRVYKEKGEQPAAFSHLFVRHDKPIALAGFETDEPESFGYSLAFRRTDSGFPVQGATIDGFFGGLSSIAATDPGYFVHRLQGKAHKSSLQGDILSGFDALPALLGGAAGLFPFVTYHDEPYFAGSGYIPVCEGGLPAFSSPENPLNSGQIQMLTDLIHEDGLQYGLNDQVPSLAGTTPVCHPGGALRPVGANVDLTANETALWDAFELTCEAQARAASGSFVDCAAPLTIASADDLTKVAGYLDCVADSVALRGTSTILQGVPVEFVAGLAGNGAGDATGELGQIYSQMRDTITSIAASGPEFARILRGFGVELRQVQARIKEIELQNELADLNFASTVSDRVTNCAVAISEASGWFKNIGTFGAHWVGAAATCANAGIQIGLGDRMRDVGKAITDEQRKIVFGDAETEVLRLEQAIAAEALEVNSLVEALQRSIGQIDALRAEANRRLQDAVWFLNFKDVRRTVIDNIMAAEEVTAKARYEQAHHNSQRWAFLARRAIEQRLGVNLSALQEDLPLVVAPQKWVDSVCATKPLDLESFDATSGYADVFIGDYVGNLENVVESYRLQFGFQEGADVAVVSLRDDVMNVRAACEVPSNNLLYQSATFGKAALAVDSTEDEWQVLGCPGPADGISLGFGSSCLAADQVDSPFQVPSLADADIRGYEITFSDGTSDCLENPEVEEEGVVTGGCSWTPHSRLTQKRSLTPGVYRFSWYSPPAVGGGVGLGRYAGAVWNEAGEEIVPRAAVQSELGIPGRVWHRHFLEFDLDEPSTVEVGFARGDDAAVTAWVDQWQVTVGAPMLDAVETQVPEEFRGPKPFEATGDTLTAMSDVCEDTDGDVFRTRWRRACDRVCPEGFGGICPEDAVEQCYRETSFFISQRSIQAGKSFVQSGFALGNFNYRLNTVGVNFVGTGLRDCEDSDAPSTCFAGGFVPYSLYHKGPYFVHNHYGEDYRAHLFEGTIEHARGLAAERYLSNPISSTDRELLTDYTRTEYQGRPMDGHFVLRVWEEDELDFEALEDVQLILDYQYWSR